MSQEKKPEAVPEVAEKPWFRGIVSEELGGDTFWSASESVAGDFGTAKVGEQATVRQLTPQEVPKNPYIVEGSKQELADTLGIKLDPFIRGHLFDAEAKRILQTRGFDAIFYPEGTLGAEELHIFAKPPVTPVTEPVVTLKVMKIAPIPVTEPVVRPEPKVVEAKGEEQRWLLDGTTNKVIDYSAKSDELRWETNVDIDVGKQLGEDVIDIHTHPDNSFPSAEDWTMLVFGHAKAVRVVLQDGRVVELSKPPDLKFRTPKAIKDKWNEIEDDIFESGRSRELTPEEIILEINQKMSQETGVILTVRDIEEFSGEEWVSNIKGITPITPEPVVTPEVVPPAVEETKSNPSSTNDFLAALFVIGLTVTIYLVTRRTGYSH